MKTEVILFIAAVVVYVILAFICADKYESRWTEINEKLDRIEASLNAE